VIALDMNNTIFQDGLFTLEKAELIACIKTLRKIRALEWDDVCRDQGLKWETIHSMHGPSGQRLYSLRITQKCRAVAYRNRETLVFLALHSDHDSAYK
jgi:hypothetical protein